MKPFLKIVLRLSLAVSIFVSLLGVLAVIWPYWELANHFRPFILLGVFTLFLGGFWLEGFSKLVQIILFWVVFNSMLLVPALLNRAHKPPMLNDTGTKLHFMTLNMWVGNKEVQRVVDFIKNENPDIFVLQEFTQKQYEQLLPHLKTLYPYQYSCAHERSCLMALFSKKPWLKIRHINRNASKWSDQFPNDNSKGRRKIFSVNPPFIEALFQRDVGKQPFYVFATHISWPFHPYRQVKDMKWVRDYVTRIKADVILAGDMNLSPWSWKLYQFQKQTKLKRHTTFLHSWPAHRLRPFVQLDHIFSSSSLKEISAKTGSFVGSDHLPVIVKMKMP